MGRPLAPAFAALDQPCTFLRMTIPPHIIRNANNFHSGYRPEACRHDKGIFMRFRGFPANWLYTGYRPEARRHDEGML